MQQRDVDREFSSALYKFTGAVDGVDTPAAVVVLRGSDVGMPIH